MKNFFFLIFTYTSLCLTAGAIPEVPANVTIAEVRLKLTPGAQREIQKEVNALRASEKYFRIKVDRVNLYFPIIERVLKEEGVPDDIKYLSIQESALISDAVSSAGAVGYWQFKDFTAREVGLRVDSKIDERKNIVSASRGAAKYFQRNNFYVKNWIYAVNAYMTGPGGVKPYVNQKDVGASSMVISEKTHWYVKRFIAHVLAFRDEVGGPHSEGLKLAEYDNGKNKTLDQIASEIKTDDSELKDYNKWLKFGKIPEDKDYIVIVPVRGKMPANLKSSEGGQPPLTRRIEEPRENTKKDYKVTRKNVFVKRNHLRAIMATESDNVVSLALKANVLSRQIIKYNDLKANQTIESGEIYYAQRKRNKAEIEYHIAQHGETLWGISQKYGVKMKKILKKNRMDSEWELKPGRKLWLRKNRPKNIAVEYVDVRKVSPMKTRKILTNPPKVDIPDEIKETQKKLISKPDPVEENVKEEPAEIPVKKPVTSGRVHIVQPGETLWAISKRYAVAVNVLQEMNGLSGSSGLSVGQELRVPADAVVQTSEPEPAVIEPKEEKPVTESSKKVHIVQPGESLWGISKRYDVAVSDIEKWNMLSSASALSVGQELVIMGDAAPQEKESTKSAARKTYEVKPGDTLYSIARKFEITVEELKSLNNKSANELSIGEVLIVESSK